MSTESRELQERLRWMAEHTRRTSKGGMEAHARLYEEAADALAHSRAQDSGGEAVDTERVAQLIAHRACHGAEHDPGNGKLHGFCIVCGTPWPCEYAGTPPQQRSEQVAGGGGVDDAMVRRALTAFYGGDNDAIRANADMMRPALEAALSTRNYGARGDNNWREGWAFAYSGSNLYRDDGELQDNSTRPFIDWRRDSAAEIRDKIRLRGHAAQAAPQQDDTPQGRERYHIVSETTVERQEWPKK